MASSAPATSTASSPSPIAEEMRQLFMHEEYDTLLARADNLKKRRRLGSDESTKQMIQVLRILSLIQLGRHSEATPLISSTLTSSSLSDDLKNTLTYAQLYVSWAANEGVEQAAGQAVHVKGNDAHKLHAQLLYRCGQCTRAGAIYERLFDAALRQLNKYQAPKRVGLRWSRANESEDANVTAIEIERLKLSVNELATNTMACYVLANQPDDVDRIRQQLDNDAYELEYNLACANISRRKYQTASTQLMQAEQLLRSRTRDDDGEDEEGSIEEDENDIEEALVPITVQKTYLAQLAGHLNKAKVTYENVIHQGKADVASLAVAANNLTVTIGQLAFNKYQQQPIHHDNDNDNNKSKKAGSKSSSKSSAINQQLLPKEQHDALVEGLKKMKSTAGKSIEKKLTIHQRRCMAYNRAILLVQMGRMDTCRTELSKLKSQFPNDHTVTLIEATLIAKQSGYDTADKVLQLACDDHQAAKNKGVQLRELQGARVQLAIMMGEYHKAAQLLIDLFNDHPAAMVTAATLLQKKGETKQAITLLTKLVEQMKSKNDKQNIIQAQKALAELLLKVKHYEEAAIVLKQIMNSDATSSDDQTKTENMAKLVVATSYFDAKQAETHAKQIMPVLDTNKDDIDVVALENSPAPKRKQVAAMKNLNGSMNVNAETNNINNSEGYDSVAKANAARERKKKKRKKRLPKDYDPNGPPPDPERWLPKTLRSDYKKKHGGNKNSRNNEQHNFRGSQGADAAAAEVAAAKNAERSAVKAAAPSVATDSNSGRPRNQRRKKNRK